MVLMTHELWVFPIVHIVLVVRQWHFVTHELVDDEADEADEAGGRMLSETFFWGGSGNMVPWGAAGLISSLMTFALVFYLGHCYSRFMNFFYACQRIETSVQDLTVLLLVHAKKHRDRWDCLRYMTAAGIVLYARVTDLAQVDENGRRCRPRVDFADWERLLLPERNWNGADESDDRWEALQGWADYSRYRKDSVRLTSELHASFGTQSEQPERKADCPPLLLPHEVSELREYPDGMMTLVLLTWCAHTLKELEVKGELKGPSFGQAQGSVLKLRQAACRVHNLLMMPIPLPYYHTLVMLQNISFGLYAYALLALNSLLTPLILFVRRPTARIPDQLEQRRTPSRSAAHSRSGSVSGAAGGARHGRPPRGRCRALQPFRSRRRRLPRRPVGGGAARLRAGPAQEQPHLPQAAQARRAAQGG
jgi:hypothetical protein